MSLNLKKTGAEPATEPPAARAPVKGDNVETSRSNAGRKSNAEHASLKAQIAKTFNDLRDKLKLIWIAAVEKLFALLVVLGADPLTDDERAILHECVEVQLDLIADENLERVRRYTRWISLALALVVLFIKVRSIFKPKAKLQAQNE